MGQPKVQTVPGEIVVVCVWLSAASACRSDDKMTVYVSYRRMISCFGMAYVQTPAPASPAPWLWGRSTGLYTRRSTARRRRSPTWQGAQLARLRRRRALAGACMWPACCTEMAPPSGYLLWVSRSYRRYDADRDDALVYTSGGCGRSDDARRREIEALYPGQVGWHAVVCFGYRFRSGQMHVLVLDNHTPTGPRRWIHVDEFHTLYTLSVWCLDLWRSIGWLGHTNSSAEFFFLFSTGCFDCSML